MVSVMCLNHPETIHLSQSMEKLSSTKPVPSAKKVGDCREKPFGPNHWSWSSSLGDWEVSTPSKRGGFHRRADAVMVTRTGPRPKLC